MNKPQWRSSFRLAMAALPALSTLAASNTPLRKEVVDQDTLYSVLPPGAIPAIMDPVFTSADSADRWMNDNETVLGVLAPDGKPRAYSAWHLDHHEIVNDRLGDLPIAATW